MPAIPEIDDYSEDTPSDEELRRRAIPVDTPPVQPEVQANPIPVGSTEDLESRGLESRMSARPIPMPTAQVPPQAGSLDDLDRADQRYENPRSAPIQTGVASLWTKAENIHNPVLRVLGEIGAGGARALDTIGSIAAPGITARIPGSTLNEQVKQHQQAAQEKEQAGVGLEKAQTHHAEAEANSIEHPQAKPDKPQTSDQVEAGLISEDIDKGVDPNKDPRVQQVADTITARQKEPTGPKVGPLSSDQATQRNSIWNPILAKNHLPTDVFTEGMTDAEAQELAGQLNNATGKTQAGVKIDMGSGTQGNARSDKSYALQSKRLDDVRKPLEQTQQRLGRLNDTLAQKSPQADALIGPELLTIMAGGQGSGLRMNEAEIARVVGGRSAWENLKASLQHWSTNPDDARSITDDQDNQIRKLVSTVQGKLVAKQKITDEAEQALLESDDPKAHRQIVSDARKKLDAIDAGQKTMSQPALEQAAKDHKVSVDEARKQAEAQGYVIQ